MDSTLTNKEKQTDCVALHRSTVVTTYHRAYWCQPDTELAWPWWSSSTMGKGRRLLTFIHQSVPQTAAPSASFERQLADNGLGWETHFSRFLFFIKQVGFYVQLWGPIILFKHWQNRLMGRKCWEDDVKKCNFTQRKFNRKLAPTASLSWCFLFQQVTRH